MSSVGNATIQAQMQILVARKQLDAVEEQGQQAVALIEAAAPAPAAKEAAPQNVQPGVGARLNVVG